MERESEVVSAFIPDERPAVVKTSRWKSRLRARLVVVALIFSDVALAVLIWAAAYALQGIWGRGDLSGFSVAAIAPGVAVWVAMRALLGLYPGYGLDQAEKLRRHVYSIFVTSAILAIFALGFQIGDLLSRLLLGLAFLGLLFAAPFVRHLAQLGLRRIRLWGRPVVILSYRDSGSQFLTFLKQEWGLGYDPVALFDNNLLPAGSFKESPYRETLAEAVDFARERGVNTAIFAMPYTRREQLAGMVREASLSFPHVLILPNLGGVTNSAVIARDLAGTFAVEIKHNLLNPWALRTKRAGDLVATVVGGMFLSPLLLVLALLVYLESGGAVFYSDIRMGRNGRPFSCVKFRSMVPEAEALLQRMLEEDAELKAQYLKHHKLRDDPRVTRVGHFLRRTSLDELPQLWNVLRGEMSLVGPRPYLPRESEEISLTQEEILRVPPGISGLWQVNGRSDTTLGERAELDVYYVRNWSVWLDLVILARTLKIVLRGQGAY